MVWLHGSFIAGVEQRPHGISIPVVQGQASAMGCQGTSHPERLLRFHVRSPQRKRPAKKAFSLFTLRNPSWLHPSRTSRIDGSIGR